MNRRRLYREYAQSKGKEAKEFVTIESTMYPDYSYDVLVTLANNEQEERTYLDYEKMVHWIIKTKKLCETN